MTLEISNLENKVDNLTQQIAIERKQDKDERKTESKLNGDKIDQV